MAKKKADTSIPADTGDSFNDIDNLINKVFEDIIDLSKVDSKVDVFYDTSVYALNYLMSRKLTGGVPKGRITGIDGLSGTGKSLIVATTMRDPRITDVIILETEGGGSGAELVEFAGVDKKKVKYMKANTLKSYKIKKSNGDIEEIKDAELPAKGLETDTYFFVEGAISKVRKLCQAISFNREKFKNRNILVVLDSLGNLTSVRQLSGTSDMGARAKELNEFFRAFDGEFEKLGMTFFFTNKVHNTFDQYNPYTHDGGEAPIYNSSVYVRLANTAENELVSDAEMKDEKERRKSALGSSFKTIKAKIVKSRFGTEMRQGSFVLDASLGPIKMSGLFTLLCDFGVIKNPSSGWYEHSLLGKFRKKDFIDLFLSDEKKLLEVFQKELDQAEEIIKKERMNLQINDDTEVDEVENEIEASISSAVGIEGFAEMDRNELVRDNEE